MEEAIDILSKFYKTSAKAEFLQTEANALFALNRLKI